MIMEDNKELPQGWISTKVSLVCTAPQYGYTTKAVNEGDLKLLRTTDITSGKINWPTVPYCKENPKDPEKYLLKNGDIVISRAGSVGVSYLIEKPDKSVFASYLIRFCPLINKRFFYYFLKSPFYWNEISEKKLGIAVPNVNATKIKEIPFLLPPLPEQHRIVAKIEELFTQLDKGVEQLQAVRCQLKTYRQAVLKYAFEGKLTEEWRKAHPQPPASELLAQIKAERLRHYEQAIEDWKTAVKVWEANGKEGKKPRKPRALKEYAALTERELGELPDMPQGWMWLRFGNILSSIGAGKSFRCEERPPSKDEFGVAKVSAVTWGEYNELESKTPFEKDKFNPKYVIKEGDLLFSRANTIELVGACVIVRKTNLKVMLSDKTLRFHFPKTGVNKEFILHFLRSAQGRKEIERLSTGNQDSMRNIGQERIKNIKTPFPPIEEQHQIIQEIESRLSVCEQVEKTIDASLKQAEALRQSILKKAFEGKLAPQDPEEEPASELLKRIRAEKEKGKQMKMFKK